MASTPAHALINLLVLGRRGREDVLAPVLIGSLLPDIAMLGFYAWQRLLGTSEAIIWQEKYYDPAWQAYFDAFNSLPLILLAWLAARWAGWRWGLWLAGGMVLHVALDLPLHHDDAHRHLWPLSDWHFESPVSYWDPVHYGRQMAMIEVGLCGFATAWLWHRHPGTGTRLTVAALAAVYAGYWLFVFSVWA